MRKTISWVVMSGLLVVDGGFSLAKPPQSNEREEAKKEVMRLVREFSPKLYAFQLRRKEIAARLREVERRFVDKKIDKDTAKRELMSLMKEDEEIRNDPEYLAERELARLYFSSPDVVKAHAGARRPSGQ